MLGGADAAPKVLSPVVNTLVRAIRAAPDMKQTPGLSGQPGDVFEEPNPMLTPAYNMVIRTLEHLGRADEAVELAREWSYRDSLNAVAHFSLGRVLLRHERDPHEAEMAFTTSLDLDPMRPEVAYQMSLALLRQNRLEQAKSYAEKALNLQAAVEARVRTNVHMEQRTAATTMQQDLQAHHQSQVEMYMSIVREKDLAEVAAKLAAHKAKGLPEHHPDDPDRPKPLGDEEVYRRAAAKYAEAQETERQQKAAQGITDTAVIPPGEFVVHNPVAGAHLVLAQVASREGMIDEAVKQARIFVSQRPLSVEGFLLQAQLYQQQGEMLQAYAALARVARLWRRRVLASAGASAAASGGSLLGKDGKPNAARIEKARKAYFDARPKEAALLKSLEQTCASANQAAAAMAAAAAVVAAPSSVKTDNTKKANTTPSAAAPVLVALPASAAASHDAATITQAQLTQIVEFKDLCEHLDKLRANVHK
jgi:tetratricopeptide (TPR) repeat protein